jgi:radical SAM protein with 4Fe4S-binding SPASM domain
MADAGFLMNDMWTVLRALENRYLDCHRLFLLHIDLTWRCPLTCPHCYLVGSHADELSKEAWIKVLDQAKSLAIAQVVLSGGEPMIRRDFNDILQAARSRGFAVLVKTTGILLTEQTVDLFADLGWIMVDISLHSIEPHVHDAFTGLPGSWNRAAAAIESLRGRNVPVRVTRSLVEGIPEDGGMLLRCAQERGCRFRESSTILRRRDGQAAGCTELDEETRMASIHSHFTDTAPMEPRPVKPLSAPCSAGHTRLYVTPKGDISPCVAWPKVLGNIADPGGLASFVESPELASVRAIKNADRDECMVCEHLVTCDFCPGQSEIFSGRPTAPYTTACENARMWTRVLGQLRSRNVGNG